MVIPHPLQSRLTVKGQATIPKTVRDHLGLKPGGRVRFFVHPNGYVLLLPVVPLSTLCGMLKRKGRRSVSIEEMNEGIAAGAIGSALPRRAKRA